MIMVKNKQLYTVVLLVVNKNCVIVWQCKIIMILKKINNIIGVKLLNTSLGKVLCQINLIKLMLERLTKLKIILKFYLIIIRGKEPYKMGLNMLVKS